MMSGQQGYVPIPGADDATPPAESLESSQSDSGAEDSGDGEDPGWPRSGDTRGYHDTMSEERQQLQRQEDGESDKRSQRKRLRRCLCIFATVFFVILLLAAIAILILLLIFVGQQPARVLTNCGPVEGKYDPIDRVFSFKGIPFAAPPTKERRWRPPESGNKTCWSGVYKADTYKDRCVQLDMKSREKTGKEDCLYLNVFTPSVDPEQPLPVMVYIHGGYLQWGDSFTPGYAPDGRVTSQLNVVFVSIQYRLNAFGFLVLNELAGNGNYGFLDQVEALQWVHQNIAGFGGDPGQVTIFGQSSGGTSVWALMMSPLAKGLFHRAWILSGSPILNQTTSEAKNANGWITQSQSIADKCGSQNVTEKCLRDLSVDEILHAIYPSPEEPPTWDILKDSMDLPQINYFEPALAVVDGEFLPEEPFVMWNNSEWQSEYSDVPLLIGSTAQELDLDPAPGKPLKHWEYADLASYVGVRLNPFGNNITNQSLALYPYANSTAELVFTNMSTDIRITCGTNIQTELASRALTSPVYRYVVTSRPSQVVEPLGIKFGARYAFHMWDLYGFFMSFDTIMSSPGPSQSDMDFGRLMQSEVMHFVRHGTMQSADWRTYPNATALLDRTLSVSARPYHVEQCKFWIANNFFPYSWIN